MGHHEARSGERLTIVDSCSQAVCPVRRLNELKREYDTALEQKSAYIAANNRKLSSAKFLKDLAEKMQSEYSGVWEKFRKPENDDSATSYADTRLKHDIENIERTMNRNKEAVEAKARALIDFFSSSSVQNHLERYHSLSQSEVVSVISVVENTLDGLANSERGMEFLSSLWSQNSLNSLKAIESVFGLINNAQSLTSEMNKFLQNFCSVLIQQVLTINARNNFRSISQVINNQRIQELLTFFAVKTGAAPEILNSYLQRTATAASNNLDNLVSITTDSTEIRSRLERINRRIEQIEPDERLSKFDGIGNVLKILAFAFATIKIVSNFKGASAKDRIAFVSSVFNVMKDGGELLIRRGSRATMIFGFFGAILGVIVNIIDAVENFQHRDPLLGVFNFLGAGVAFVGLFAEIAVGSAEIMGLSAATAAMASMIASVCMIIGIAILILIYIFTDPPFIDFLEDSYYGVDHIIRIEDTIDRFFKLSVFDMSIYLEGDDPDKRLIIVSRALDDSYPVSLKLNRDGRSLGTIAIDPTSDNYLGKANIRKDVFWDYERRRTRKLIINRFWELWDDPDREIDLRVQQSYTYALYVSLDPDRDEEMEIRAHMDPIEFPPFQPMIRELTFDNNYYVYLRTGYLKYTGNGQVNLTMRTTEARGYSCQILWSNDNNRTWTEQSGRIDQDTTNHNIVIPAPPADDTYTLNIIAKLFNNRQREAVHTHRISDIRVGTEAYLRSRGIR